MMEKDSQVLLNSQPFAEIECDMGHRFILALERRDDISVTDVESLDQRPYAIYRNRSLVECPYCHLRACHLTGMRGEMNVRFTPSEGARA